MQRIHYFQKTQRSLIRPINISIKPNDWSRRETRIRYHGKSEKAAGVLYEQELFWRIKYTPISTYVALTFFMKRWRPPNQTNCTTVTQQNTFARISMATQKITFPPPYYVKPTNGKTTPRLIKDLLLNKITPSPPLRKTTNEKMTIRLILPITLTFNHNPNVDVSTSM